MIYLSLISALAANSPLPGNLLASDKCGLSARVASLSGLFPREEEFPPKIKKQRPFSGRRNGFDVPYFLSFG